MVLYDFLAPAYDPVFESIYRPFRTRALQMLPTLDGATILDLACGTGQNFPLFAERIGERGKIIGVDLSSGMLRCARRRVKRNGLTNVSLIQSDAAALHSQPALSALDAVVCTYGFSAMREWRAAFEVSWNLLKPGGVYLIHDIDAEKRSLHSWAVEMATRSNFSQGMWHLLQNLGTDFRMDYLDPSAHLFGGRLFVARGTKP